MHVEGAEAGHAPYHFGQHTKGHYHLYVGLIAAQLLDESLVFHLDGLQNRDAVGLCILLDGRSLKRILMPAYGLVGLCPHCHHLVAALNEPLQRLDSKLGRTHKHDS